jgi:glycosyltransferase involved in cell wall biosynthesis
VRILTFTTLFPNTADPVHGVFVENRLRHLVASGRVEARVLAPVPWFPFRSKMFGRYGRFARAPRSEQRHGLTVDHPRYLVIPKVGMNLAPRLLYRAARPVLARLLSEGIELIDAHYFYPDGVAAAMLARDFDLPLTITARGTDLNLIARFGGPRRKIEWAASTADHMITVSQALKGVLVEMGIDGEGVSVLRNGVDLEAFQPPEDREAVRRALGLRHRALVCVGNLVPLKGYDLVIRACAELPDTDLLIAGDGPERSNLEGLANDLGIGERLRLLGRVDHAALGRFYGAADALVLASSREGWPNVLLEAMACGTPVVANRVGGTAEAVTEPAAGVLVEERSPAALAAGIRRLLDNPPDRADTRRYAERFSWQATTEGQLDIFSRVLARRRA